MPQSQLHNQYIVALPMAAAQSGAWEARQAIPECTSPDRLSQSAVQICTG